MKNLQIQAIPAFSDNYLWLIHNTSSAIIVDPGDATPVLAYLNQHQLDLCAIVLTHHHSDHIGGVTELLRHFPATPVYGALADQLNGRIAAITHGCQQGDSVDFPQLPLRLHVLEVPGHTNSHLAWYCPELASLFCGDTLFAGGCGRLFEGTPAQMLASLQTIAALPAETAIYCAHEYTLSNLRFALAAEPDNTNLQRRFEQVREARAHNQATVPSLLGLELQTNPFLRTDSAGLIQHLHSLKRLPSEPDPLQVFTALRSWKNSF